MSKNLHDKLLMVSSEPGVYLMKDAAGKIIYVGKATNLKKRLSSYFSKPVHTDMKTGVLVKKIAEFETIITASEKEALILESNLIKKYKPKYNVILKDGKRYPSLRIDIKSDYPNLAIVRKIAKDGAKYFGPFSSALAVHQTLRIINKTFKLRKCKGGALKNRSRPCLNYQIGACLAPCCLDVARSEYDDIVNEVMMFLKGRTTELVQDIKSRMKVASEHKNFEKAAQLRDKMFALEKTFEKQVAVTTDLNDRDVLAVAKMTGNALITSLTVRGGFLLGTRHFSFNETFASDAEIIETFIRQNYEDTPYIPKEILVSSLPDNSDMLEEFLSVIKGKKVRILSPQRGEKSQLVNMAVKNAVNRLREITASDTAIKNMLARLKDNLKMEHVPLRVECFDNSNISGKDAVSGMVVFENGQPDKSSYRKFKIKTANKQDDYACMSEVLTRRYGNGGKTESYPDLLVVDGGKGQLNIAVSVVKDLNLFGKFGIIGIAKKDDKKGETEDKIYKYGRINPVNMGKRGDTLLFLQKIRDEAHRFAISFHRQRRSKSFIHSELDDILGIGKKRKKILLTHFKSIEKIRTATLDEISALPGMNNNVAKEIKKKLHH
ncbi:MAG: excinuclease ABC subunit UvrC [Deltaproteobacteria bacterium]|nr:excinuclease ABC subunit UvrC [Deltaproteobacteria bacterium]